MPIIRAIIWYKFNYSLHFGKEQIWIVGWVVGYFTNIALPQSQKYEHLCMFYTAVQALKIMLCFPCTPFRCSQNLKPLRSVGKGMPLLEMNEELKTKNSKINSPVAYYF